MTTDYNEVSAYIEETRTSRREDEPALDVPEAVARDDISHELVGSSPLLQAVLARARKVAWTDSTVLVTGETGTGKELLARSIHRWSRRANGPFVSLNCAAIPPALIASELFGHERGAFTGALQRRQGRFEVAAGGTLFLDEVGELPAETQVALLRVLQEREFERVGGTRSMRADVRIVAATNRDLGQAVEDGSFRSDLYYRLHVFPLEMPALRERGDDILLLTQHFLERYARAEGRAIAGIEQATLGRLQAYPWPGNVRELQNVIERSLVLCESDVFALDESWLGQGAARRSPTPEPAPTPIEAQVASPPRSLRLTLEEIQREAILDALQSRNWVVGGPRGAAAQLGLKRTTLQARMQKLGISQPRFAGIEDA